jgi:murein DD-endopeptidase MepM/ murein hydrolase activator NlpD
MRLRYPIDNIRNFAPIQPNGSEIYISQWFGQNPQIYQKFGMTGHDGIDIAAPKGTPVKASHDGWIVESVAKDSGYGLRVQIYFEEDDYGWLIMNGHFDKLAFPAITYNLKQRKYPVKEGQVIGWVDSTGFSTGHHDHFGVRQLKNYVILNYNNGTLGWINPFPYMKDPNVMETTHMKLFIDKRTDPPTIYPAFGVDDESNLKWFASQNGKSLPLKADGSIDFSRLTYDGEIK